MINFSFVEVGHWERYEKVRESGEFNMFDQRAQRKTGLTDDQYTFVMNNYDVLKNAHDQEHA